MPLDYAVGILDYRLIWNDSAAEPQQQQQQQQSPPQPVGGETAAETASDAAACFPELDEEGPSGSVPQEACVHQDACVLHPEFRKLDIGIAAISNKTLEASLAFLKSAVEKLKKVMSF